MMQIEISVYGVYIPSYVTGHAHSNLYLGICACALIVAKVTVKLGKSLCIKRAG